MCLGAAVLVSSGCLDFDALSGNWEQGVSVDAARPDATSPPEDAASDLTAQPDLLADDGRGGDAAVDAGRDDLTALADLTMMDAVQPPDAPMGDLVVGPDLAPPPDLVALPDFVRPPDLTPPPDLVVVPDMACVPKTQSCDVMCQNCMSGQKCGLLSNQLVCMTPGAVATGGKCTVSPDNCAARNMCVVVSTALPLSLCRLYCYADSDCTNGGRCAITVATINNVAIKVCTDPVTNCQPVTQVGCTNSSCFVVVDQTGETGCHQAGAGQNGASCLTSYDCAPSYTCYQGKCRRTCFSNSECPTLSLTTCQSIPGWSTTRLCVP